MKFNPVMVISPARSGSSTIARLLQMKCAIMMDEGPIRKDEINPTGYYEDHKLVEINQKVIRRTLGIIKEKGLNRSEESTLFDMIDPTWAVEFYGWIFKRNLEYSLWGFKDPRMTPFIHWTLQFFDNPIFIQPFRTDEQVIKSQFEKLGSSEQKFASPQDRHSFLTYGLRAYHELIDKHLSGYKIHKIDLTKYVPEKQLTEKLKDILNG